MYISQPPQKKKTHTHKPLSPQSQSPTSATWRFVASTSPGEGLFVVPLLKHRLFVHLNCLNNKSDKKNYETIPPCLKTCFPCCFTFLGMSTNKNPQKPRGFELAPRLKGRHGQLHLLLLAVQLLFQLPRTLPQQLFAGTGADPAGWQRARVIWWHNMVAMNKNDLELTKNNWRKRIHRIHPNTIFLLMWVWFCVTYLKHGLRYDLWFVLKNKNQQIYMGEQATSKAYQGWTTPNMAYWNLAETSIFSPTRLWNLIPKSWNPQSPQKNKQGFKVRFQVEFLSFYGLKKNISPPFCLALPLSLAGPCLNFSSRPSTLRTRLATSSSKPLTLPWRCGSKWLWRLNIEKCQEFKN